LLPYGLLKHVHMPEIAKTIERLSGGSAAGMVFTPHLVPMTRGILATIYCRGRATTGQCLDAARRFYAGRAFVRVTDKPPQTKWATGSNLAFVSYAADPERNLVIAMGVVDNLGKGAAGQAVLGATCLSSSSHFPLKPNSNCVKPVVLPPGRDRLATKPRLTGSVVAKNTIGTSRVTP
jgi:N-acetyl-gamma-glutamyl-phosphate reductase